MDWNRQILGVSLGRWLLASAGLVFGGIGMAGRLNGGTFAADCINGAAAFSFAGHCGWCYAAVAALLLAAAPSPRELSPRPAR